MTIDARREKLVERHEVLTEIVELMPVENRQREERLGQIIEGIARLLHVALYRDRAANAGRALATLVSLFQISAVREDIREIRGTRKLIT